MNLDGTVLSVGAMLLLNVVGWAFSLGTLYQKMNALEKRQDRHEGLPSVRAHGDT